MLIFNIFLLDPCITSLYFLLNYFLEGNPNNPVVILRSPWSLQSSDSADRGRSIIRVTLKVTLKSGLGFELALLASDVSLTSLIRKPFSFDKTRVVCYVTRTDI